MYREVLSFIFTIVLVANVSSLVWLLVELRKEGLRDSVQAAISLTMFFTGLLLSQVYTFLVMSNPPGAERPAYLGLLFAVVAALALGGGAWLALIFRPRRVPVLIWASAIAAVAMAVAVGRWGLA